VPRSPDVSVVFPVFNEAGNLETLVKELHRALATTGQSWEIVAVDDGSTDASLDILLQLAATHRDVRVVHLDRNAGQSAALLAGFEEARGSIVITLDADLQNDPADIPTLLGAIDVHQAVSGVRVHRQDTWLRRVASRIANRVRARLLRDGVTDVGCSLKAYRAEVLTDLPAFDGLHRFLPALLKTRGITFHEIPVRHRPRRHGVSKYGINNRLWRGLVDLAGVRWLQARGIGAGLSREIDVWTPKRSGSRSDSPDKDSSSRDSSSSGSSPSEGGRASYRTRSGS
jgi:glycosyltransferase involved in cell wall biosynthesis